VNCKRCHRELKGKKSIERGIGPNCYRKWVKEGYIKREGKRARTAAVKTEDKNQIKIFEEDN
jgi:hypothetical protein